MAVAARAFKGEEPIDLKAEAARLAQPKPLRNGKPEAEEPPPRPVFNLQPELPDWSIFLRYAENDNGEPVRYRVFWGGRGGAKSRTLGAELLVRGTLRTERILCTREFQRSTKDSVKRLLDDEISRLGLGLFGNGFYLSTDKEIRGKNGTLFLFEGLHRNENGIKSLEGITIAWVEEAASVSQSSLDALIPTIRQEGAEIWISYNPRYATDPVDKMFRGKDGPPPGSIVQEVHATDNPWFPDVLRRDMEYDRRRDPDKWAHIWRGQYLQRSEAKVFRNWRAMRFDTPDDAVLRFGADWGFASDPSVLVRCFLGRWSGEAWNSDPIADPEGRVLFVDREAYEVGCPVDDLPALFGGTDDEMAPGHRRWENTKGRKGIPGADTWKIIADSARPELIDHMKRRGFNIEPAVKGPGSLEEGVTFLQSYDTCVHEDCKHVVDELTFYSYKVDKLTGEIFPVLADKDNHTIDALRYACENVRRAGDGKFRMASTGTRAAIVKSDQEAQMRRAMKTGIEPGDQEEDAGGGAGWGSAPGMRTGVI